MKRWGRSVVTFLLVFFFLSLLHWWNDYKIDHYGLPCTLSNDQKCLQTYEEGKKIWWNGYSFQKGEGELAFYVEVVGIWDQESSAGEFLLLVLLPPDMPQVAKKWVEEANHSFYAIETIQKWEKEYSRYFKLTPAKWLNGKAAVIYLEGHSLIDTSSIQNTANVRYHVVINQVEEGEELIVECYGKLLKVKGPRVITTSYIREIGLSTAEEYPYRPFSEQNLPNPIFSP